MKIIASDFDGTLLVNNKVSKLDIMSIEEFRREKNLFGICTGRPINSVKKELNRYGISYDFIIGSNGSIAINSAEKELFSYKIARNLIVEIEKILLNFNITDGIISDGYENYNFLEKESIFDNQYISEQIKTYYLETENTKSALQLVNDLNISLNKIGVIAYPNNQFVAIGMKGINKAHGILKYVEYFNYKNTVYVIGDDFNDIPMFKKFKSFGISSGVSEAILHTNFIVNSVNEAISAISKY